MTVRRSAVALALLLALGAAACGGGPEEDTAPGTPTETWDLLVLADSSGWGVAEAWAELIRRDEGVAVNVLDFATGMQSGGGLLQHLTTEGDPQREAVREADVISVWGSPASMVWKSDANLCYEYPDGTRPPTRLSEKDFEPYEQLWRDILGEITSLRSGQPTALRTRDIYNPVISHHVAAGTGEACEKAHAMISSTVREASRLAGAKFVPVYRAFNGPDGMEDPKERDLFEDMVHLNDEGAALMAHLHHEVGYDELTGE